ncbi:CLUMA_CG021481, isoform A [Clunio marinus]|uniref:CLUMA_CG021481, isoform A n=1 Tax=Clunio marinus TaxID=568069 RepID=A0A1J1J963_9DIPT|nr:CLUMA_CG021481, isoform A [Clunio marinus]
MVSYSVTVKVSEVKKLPQHRLELHPTSTRHLILTKHLQYHVAQQKKTLTVDDCYHADSFLVGLRGLALESFFKFTKNFRNRNIKSQHDGNLATLGHLRFFGHKTFC